MKEKLFIFIFLLFSFLNITYLQPILIPLEPENLEDNLKKNSKNDKNIKEEEEEKPIIITQELKGKDGSNIRITRIHYGRTKNLNGKKNDGVTPIQIMRIFDDRVNSIFEDMIRQSLGLKLFLNALSSFDDNENVNNKEENISKNKTNDEKSIFDDFDLDIDEDENTKVDNKNNSIAIQDKKNNKRILKKYKNGTLEEENIQKFGKLKVNMDNLKKKIKKGKKPLSKKQIIFSRVCKYIFYSLILFTIYILVKKVLEILEIIDPDSAVEIKIENDETSKLKKNTESKQS